MSSEAPSLQSAVDTLCAALHEHAIACEAGAPVPEVISKGELVRDAVLQHERLLMEHARWSSPLRHLDPPEHRISSVENIGQDTASRVLVTAVYHLSIGDPDTLVDAVRGRYATSEIDDLHDAIERLVRNDGWDPNVISNGGQIAVERVDVSVNIS